MEILVTLVLLLVVPMLIGNALRELNAPDCPDYADMRLEPPQSNDEDTTPPTVVTEDDTERLDCEAVKLAEAFLIELMGE